MEMREQHTTDSEVLHQLNLVDLAIAGLTTDGAHHKQWYLEQILHLLVSEPQYIEYKRTRTWSYKNMLPQWAGDWHVEVLDENDKVLERLSFRITDVPSE